MTRYAAVSAIEPLDLADALIDALKSLCREKKCSLGPITETAQYITTSSAAVFYSIDGEKKLLIRKFAKSSRTLPEKIAMNDNADFIWEQNETTGIPGSDSLYFGEWILHSEFRSGIVVPLRLPEHSGFLVLNSSKESWFTGSRYRFCELYKEMVETLAKTMHS